MLTKAGFVALIGGVVVLTAGRVFGLLELFVIGCAALLVVAMAMVYVAVRRLQIQVSRHLSPPRVHAGNPCRVDLLLRNRSRLRSPVVRLRDDVSGTQGVELLVAPMRTGAGTQAVYRLPTERRGVIGIGPLRLTVGDPFGMARITTTGDRRVSLIVYPRIHGVAPVSRATGSDLERETVHHHHVAPAGDEFYALREYAQGDDLRRVHWPSSARHDELMVRQDEVPWHGRLSVLLDTRNATPAAVFEDMVSAAASVAVANLRRGDQVRLITTGGLDVPWGTGPHQADRVLEALATVGQSDHIVGEALERLTASTGGGALVAFTSDSGELEDGLLRRAVGSYRSRIMVLFTSSGAMPSGGGSPVRSTTVVQVTPQQPFPHAWARAIGPAPRALR